MSGEWGVHVRRHFIRETRISRATRSFPPGSVKTRRFSPAEVEDLGEPIIAPTPIRLFIETFRFRSIDFRHELSRNELRANER